MKHSVLALTLSTVLFSTPALAKPADCKVNINTATASEISECLDGIGKKKAEGVVAYREQEGKFEKVEQLTNVSGIGEKTVERNRSKIVIEEEVEATDNQSTDKAAEAKPADKQPTNQETQPTAQPTEPKPEGK
jgi:competence protein ComEA